MKFTPVQAIQSPKLQLVPLSASTPRPASSTIPTRNPSLNQITTSGPSDIQTCSNCKVPTTEPPKLSEDPVGLSLPEKLIYPEDDDSYNLKLSKPIIDIRFNENSSEKFNENPGVVKIAENGRSLSLSDLEEKSFNKQDSNPGKSLNSLTSNFRDNNNVPQSIAKPSSIPSLDTKSFSSIGLSDGLKKGSPNNGANLEYNTKEIDYTTYPPVLSPTEDEYGNGNLEPTSPQTYNKPESQSTFVDDQTPQNKPQTSSLQSSQPQYVPKTNTKLHAPDSEPASENTQQNKPYSSQINSELPVQYQKSLSESNQNIPISPFAQKEAENILRAPVSEEENSSSYPKNSLSQESKPKSSNPLSFSLNEPTGDLRLESPSLPSKTPINNSSPKMLSNSSPVSNSKASNAETVNPSIKPTIQSQFQSPSPDNNGRNNYQNQPSPKLEIQPLAYEDPSKLSTPNSNQPKRAPIPLPQSINAKDKVSKSEPRVNYASPRNENLEKPENFIRNNLPSRYNVPELDDQLDGLLYKFKYAVGYHGHSEKGDRIGNKAGAFYSVGRDGFKRTIEYTADGDGFKPKILWERVPEDDIPREETEKELGLKEYEFKWFYLR